MPAYQPGNGLNHEALERLRSRKQGGDGVLELPAQDESKQWDQLLGAGAQKKPRCGVCTRPFSAGEQITEQLICHSCMSAVEGDARKGMRSPKGCKAKVCVTPSTEAASDASDCGAEDMPKVKARLPTCELVMLEAVKKGLHGDWVGYGGRHYWIDSRQKNWWTCVAEGSTKTYALIYDPENGVVWWGNERSHFVKAADLCTQPDHISWYDFDDIWCKEPDFVFYRDQENQSAPRNERHYQASIGGQCQSQGDTYAATAISEIEEQLFAPDSKGFVWIDKWNERFLKHLGTLRAFLESRPDRFAVIPGKGRGYRVAAVQPTDPLYR